MLPPPPGLATGLERDRTNQPGPIFPQFPGIILELPAGLLAPAVQVGTVTGTSGFPNKTGMHTSKGIRPRGKYRFTRFPLTLHSP
jgi:hypothetical protein